MMKNSYPPPKRHDLARPPLPPVPKTLQPASTIKRLDFPLPSESALQSRRNTVVGSVEPNLAESCGGCCSALLMIFAYVLMILTLPFSLAFSMKVVKEYERAVIFRLGRLRDDEAKGPGLFFVLPCIDSYRKVDLRLVSFDVPPQEILSKDSVTVSVDAVVYFRVSNPTISVTNVNDAFYSTKLLAQTTLRNVLGTKNLAEMLSQREHISHMIQSMLDEATDPWGVKVERVEMKDLRLPEQLMRSMAAEAEASREARAKIIAAEGEKRASKSLTAASEVLCQSSAAIQLRYLQVLSSIASHQNETIVFPLPVDLIRFLFYGKNGVKKTVAKVDSFPPPPKNLPPVVVASSGDTTKRSSMQFKQEI